jgi:hypothetical protein
MGAFAFGPFMKRDQAPVDNPALCGVRSYIQTIQLKSKNATGTAHIVMAAIGSPSSLEDSCQTSLAVSGTVPAYSLFYS